MVTCESGERAPAAAKALVSNDLGVVVLISVLLVHLPWATRPKGRRIADYLVQSLTFLNLNAFPMTETELRLMAAAAIIGESSSPKNGYRSPAATGTPSAL